MRHANRRYWFCGEACRERFEADPARFTGHAAPVPETAPVYTCPCHPAVGNAVPADCPECGMALEPWTPAPKRVEYVCPMHPDIVRDTPESCPICGMALEPRAAPTGGEPSPELADMRRRLAVACALTLPVLATAMSEMTPALDARRWLGPVWFGWLQAALATPVVPARSCRRPGAANGSRRRGLTATLTTDDDDHPEPAASRPAHRAKPTPIFPPYHSIRHAAPTRQSSSPGVCPASCVHPAWSTSFPAPHCRTRSSAIRTSRPSGGSPTRCSA